MKKITRTLLLVLVLAVLGALFAVSVSAEGETSGTAVTTADALKTEIENAAIDGTAVTVVLGNDISLGETAITVASGQNVTLDLGGYTLTYDGYGESEPLLVEAGATFKMMNGNVIVTATKETTPRVIKFNKALKFTYTDDNGETQTVSYAKGAAIDLGEYAYVTGKTGDFTGDVTGVTKGSVLNVAAPAFVTSAGDLTIENVYAERAAGGIVSQGALLSITGGSCDINSLKMVLDASDSIGCLDTTALDIQRAETSIEFNADGLIIIDSVKPVRLWKGEAAYMPNDNATYPMFVDYDDLSGLRIRGAGAGVNATITNSRIVSSLRGLSVVNTTTSKETLTVTASRVHGVENYANHQAYAIRIANGQMEALFDSCYISSSTNGMALSDTSYTITFKNCYCLVAHFRTIGTGVVLNGGTYRYDIFSKLTCGKSNVKVVENDVTLIGSKTNLKGSTTVNFSNAKGVDINNYFDDAENKGLRNPESTAKFVAGGVLEIPEAAVTSGETTTVYTSAATAFAKVKAGDTVVLYGDVADAEIINPINVYTTGSSFTYSLTGAADDTPDNAGVYSFAKAENAFTVNFYDRAYGNESGQILFTRDVLSGGAFEYTGEDIVYDDLVFDSATGGYVYTVGGWEMYDGEVSLGTLTTLGEDYIGKTVDIYPTFDAAPITFAVKEGDTVTPYTAESNFDGVLEGAENGALARLYADIQDYEVLLEAKTLTVDLNGYVIYTNAKKVVFEAQQGSVLTLYSSREGGKIFSGVVADPNKQSAPVVNVKGDSQLYVGFVDENGNGMLDDEEKLYEGNLTVSAATIFQLYSGSDAIIYGTTLILAANDQKSAITFRDGSEDRTLLMDTCSFYSAGVGAGKCAIEFFNGNCEDSVVIKNSSFVSFSSSTPLLARIADASLGTRTIYLSGVSVYNCRVAGDENADGTGCLLITAEVGCQFSNCTVNNNIRFVDADGNEAVLARVPAEEKENTVDYYDYAAYPVEEQSKTATATHRVNYKVVALGTEGYLEAFFRRYENGTLAQDTRVYYSTELISSVEEIENTYFTEREDMTDATGAISIDTTAGTWDGNVYSYYEVITVGDAFYTSLGANVALGESIDLRYFIPTVYADAIHSVQLDGVSYALSETVGNYYKINVAYAPKDAYAAFEVKVIFDINGDGVEDHRIYLTYSLADYLETLASMPADNTGYTEAAQRLVPYIAKYVVEIAEHFGTSDTANDGYNRLLVLAEGAKIGFKSDSSRVIVNDAETNPGVEAAYLLLESRVGYIFTIAEALVADNITFALTMLDDEGNAVGEAIVGTVGEASSGAHYVSFGTIEAKQLLYKVKITVTTTTTETAEDGTETTTVTTADVYYDLYTYVYNMVESGTDDGFATATYAYADAVKTFEDKEYSAGRLE